MGLFIALSLERLTIPVQVRALIAVGLLGGYTTFSTLSLESIQLLESGELLRAVSSLVGNLALGLAAAYLGLLLGRAL